MQRDPVLTHRLQNTLNDMIEAHWCDFRLIYNYCTKLFSPDSSVKAIVMPELQYELPGFV